MIRSLGRTANKFDSTEIWEGVIFVCTAEGCNVKFWRNKGYEPSNLHLRCNSHREVRPFMVLRPRGDGGFEYTCPVAGCEETKPYLKAVSKLPKEE
jgi:hypothetical protein